MSRRPVRQFSVIAALVSALAFAMGVKAWDQARARMTGSHEPATNVVTIPMQMWPAEMGPIRLAQVNGSGSSSPAGLGAPGSNRGGISPGNPSGATTPPPNSNESLGDAGHGSTTDNAAGGATHLPSGQNPAATGATSATGTASPGAAPTGSGR